MEKVEFRFGRPGCGVCRMAWKCDSFGSNGSGRSVSTSLSEVVVVGLLNRIILNEPH